MLGCEAVSDWRWPKADLVVQLAVLLGLVLVCFYLLDELLMLLNLLQLRQLLRLSEACDIRESVVTLDT